MLLILAVVFFAAWLLTFVVFHVTSFFIHLLILAAAIALAMHFLRRPASTA